MNSRNLSVRKTICISVFSFFILTACKKTEFTAKDTSSISATDKNNVRTSGLPNVIIILADDVGYEIPTCDGGGTYSTPNIDNMSANGMLFKYCHTEPLCSPSRFLLMTGKYSFRNYFNWGVMNPNEKTLATLFKSVGYTTCAAGKWQFDGGDASIHSLGFDTYSVWNPYEIASSGSQGSNYKDPKVYQNGAYLPDSSTNGKYSDDIFTQYVNDFIDSNKNNNFFVYYATCLCHSPYSPTPDDPEFATWDPYQRLNDTTFFPSMVAYLDKKVGEIVSKLKDLGLYDNTIILVSGDNGTPHHIHSVFGSDTLEGEKSATNELGTHVPLIVSWPNGIKNPGLRNSNLISFTDFMTTFQEMTNADVSSYGTLDGVSFYKQLAGDAYVPHPWLYTYYDPHTNSGNNNLKIYVQDSVYKLYDSVASKPFRFYNMETDINETHPIKKGQMTPQQKTVYNNFKLVLANMRSQY